MPLYHIKMQGVELMGAQLRNCVFRGRPELARRWDPYRKPGKCSCSWHIRALVVFNSLFSCIEGEWPVHFLKVFHQFDRVKEKETCHGVRRCDSMGCVSNEPLSLMWTGSQHDITFIFCMFWWLSLWLPADKNGSICNFPACRQSNQKDVMYVTIQRLYL